MQLAHMAVALLAVTAPWAAHQAPPVPRLVQLPCKFIEGLPVAAVHWFDGRKTRSANFVLDSGAETSFLFRGADPSHIDTKSQGPWRSRKVRLWSQEGPKHAELGAVTLVEPPKNYIGADLHAWFRQAKVAGILGADFFASRDVFLDYGKSEIWVGTGGKNSTEADKLPAGFERVPVVPWGSRWVVAVVVDPKPLRLTFAFVDTGTSGTALPTSSAPNGRPNSAEATTTIGPFQVAQGWKQRCQIYIAPLEQPFQVPIKFVDPTDPALCPGDLSGRVLLRFQRNEIWIDRAQGTKAKSRVSGEEPRP